MQIREINRVTLVGIIIGILSFSLRFAVFKPNRLAQGSPLHLWDVLSWIEFLLLSIPWVVLLVSSLFFPNGRVTPILDGILGNVVIVIVFFIIGRISTRLLISEQPFARVSMGFGTWGLIGAGYVLINSSLQESSIPKLWRSIISLSGISILVIIILAGLLNDLSIFKEFAVRKDRFLREFFQHLLLSGFAVAFAIIIGIPLGIWAFRRKLLEKPIFFVVNTIQTVPSLALFGIMIAPLSILSYKYPFLREIGIKGVGMTPAVIALTLYALLPITRNTYTSLKVLDPSVLDSAKGMGMSKIQMLMQIQIPLSLPILLSGIRISMVQAIGNTTVAALIGAGGFGVFVFQGLGQAVPDLILLGAIPVVLLAICIDKIMQIIIRGVTPRGLKREREIIQ